MLAFTDHALLAARLPRDAAERTSLACVAPFIDAVFVEAVVADAELWRARLALVRLACLAFNALFN